MRAVYLFALILILGAPFRAQAAAPAPADPYSLRRLQALEAAQKRAPDAELALKALLNEQPNDKEVILRLAIVVAARAHLLEPGPKRRAAMKEARETYERAGKAGSDEPLIATALKEINPDGTENITPLSAKPEAEKLLRQAEDAFSKNDFSKAKKLYLAALKIEPNNYFAAVYLGDAYFTSGEYNEAIEWFGKAIALNPNVEKAYRYRGDALLRLRRRDDALDQYLLGVVADPYNKYSWHGLQTGCQVCLIKPWIPARDMPAVQVTVGEKGPEIILPEKFTFLDVAYAAARVKWQTENRATRFPAGQAYRQTLEEEVAALSTLITVYGDMKRAESPTPEVTQALAAAGPAIEELAQIEKSGLLEAYILFFRANADVAADYPAYREKHREDLRKFLVKYYLHLP